MNIVDAVINNNIQEVKYYIENGYNIHVEDDLALRWAAEKGYLDIVKYLIGHGANIHAENDSPLWFAAFYNRFDVVKCLIEHGADFHLLFNGCGNLLKRVAENKHFNMVEYLLSLHSVMELKELFFQIDNLYIKYLILERIIIK
ncbi:ankyrin repeat domain-containing protein [Candidatus Pacearchaeota archaeon]|jgi:ankyrin repeat protein|nr:ankyrin repeat domain-containing protein [Candidatus Pacearchaeota archaeon]